MKPVGKTMKRRAFLKTTAATMAGGAAFPGALADWVSAAETKSFDIRGFFESKDSEVIALSQRVFDKCILEKLRPPTEPLRHIWVQPGGPYYLGQWIWDRGWLVQRHRPAREVGDFRLRLRNGWAEADASPNAQRSKRRRVVWRHLHDGQHGLPYA